MADARRSGLHVHETRLLSYGHLGTAAYDDRNHKWTFLRQHQTQQEDDLQKARAGWTGSSHFLLADERTWTSAPDAAQASRTVQDARPSRGLQNYFLKRIPDTAFVAVDFPASRNTVASWPKHRPPGNVLAFGHARRPFDSSLHNNIPYTPMIAIRSCSSTETLQLFVIEARQVAIPNETGLSDLCKVPFISDQVSGAWTDSADEILQVASSSHEKGTQFLVVKPSGTTVLWPLLSKSKVSEELLDPCPVVAIPRSRTGGQPHAYADFNPHDQNLVAIVDTSGQWSIWKLTGRKSRSARILNRVSLKASNNIGHIEQQSRSSKVSTYRNTWHRVCWLTNPEGVMDRLLVCNRRFAAVFDWTGLLLGEVDMRLGPLPDRNLILDVKNSGRRTDCVFVLTTSRFLILSSSQSSDTDGDSNEALELVCSWNHYRDRTDLDLRMNVLESSEDSWVLLYSTTSHLAIIYRFGQEDVHSTTVSMQDPSTFQLPQQLHGRMRDVSDITMCPAAFSTQFQPAGTVRFGLIKLVVCLGTGEIIEALYKHELGQFGVSNHVPEAVLHLPMPRTLDNDPISAKYVMDEDLDDFVVPDGEGTDHYAPTADSAQSLEDTQRVSPSSRDWQRLLRYEALKEIDNGNVSFGSALEQVTDRHLESLEGENKTIPMHLISDLADRCRIMDVERDSEIADQWLDALAFQGSTSIEPIAGVVGGVSISSRRQLLLDLYESSIRAYVEPLSDQVTDRGRVNRERLVRQIVGDVFFGAFTSNSGAAPLPPSASPRPYWTTTGASEAPSPSMGLDSDDPESSQAQTPDALPDTEEPAFARLQRYVTCRNEVPPLRLTHHQNISNILAHLPDSIEEDPADYSYQQTNQKLKLAQEEMAAELLDPKERRKALRTAARLQRKLEKTQLMSQDVVMRRNMLPGIRSGPNTSGLPAREVQSSQPAAPSSSQTVGQGQGRIPEFSMTQPERGTYGARQAEKRSRKGTKRRAGF